MLIFFKVKLIETNVLMLIIRNAFIVYLFFSITLSCLFPYKYTFIQIFSVLFSILCQHPAYDNNIQIYCRILTHLTLQLHAKIEHLIIKAWNMAKLKELGLKKYVGDEATG